jgi:prepilin-type N-terminal cleavage/methylation domain-containing protein
MKKAFTLIEILIVVSIIGLLSAIAVPSFMGYRHAANEKMKEVNISNINAAKDQWAVLFNKAPDTSVSWDDISDYVGNGINSLSDLDIDGESITINPVGTPAVYQTSD